MFAEYVLVLLLHRGEETEIRFFENKRQCERAAVEFNYRKLKAVKKYYCRSMKPIKLPKVVR
jgi:hypothetical protein